MGLIPQYDKTPLTPYDQFDHDTAKKLIAVIGRHRKLMRHPRSATYAKWIHLIRDSGINQDRIMAVIVWLEVDANFTHEMTPKVYSGETFVEKFERIEEAIKRQQRQNPIVAETELGSAVHHDLELYHWPGDGKAKLRAAIELSLINYTALAATLARRGKTKPPDRLAAEVLSNMGTERTFLPRWFRRAFDISRKKPNKFQIMNYVFATDHWMFERMAQEWAGRYGAGPDKLKALLEAVRG